MKITIQAFTLSLLLSMFGYASLGQQTLPEVTVVSANYKYLKSVDDTNSYQPVRLLEHRAASYELKNTDFYEEDYENYFISYYIPNGQILAFYDSNGKILHTAEKYKNVALPKSVIQAVASKYPGWTVSKDVYLVSYFSEKNDAKKEYKLLLENGKKRMRVKKNDKGDFLE